MKEIKSVVDFKLVIYLLGLTLLFESIFVFIDLLVCLYYDKESLIPLLISLIIISGTGMVLMLSTNKIKGKEPTKKDSFVLVFLAWLILSLFGTLPYLLTNSINNFTNAFFESVSGFTTTGASILKDVESIPKGVLFWRSETHWIGGMGIIILMLAIFPFFKTSGIHLLGAESSSVIFERIKPKLIDTIKRLWGIYVLLTLIEIIFLYAGGMELFDSICHSFGTIATGGFSTKNTSISGYSPFIQYIVTIFMLLSGINFIVHYYFIKRNFKKVLTNEELSLYLKIFFVATILITFNLFIEKHLPLSQSIRHASFQVASILTTTGYTTSDYNVWSSISKGIIFLLMLSGGCSGSTSGGIKVIRYVIGGKNIINHFKKLIFPNMVGKIKFSHIPIERAETLGITGYFFTYLGIIIIGTFILLMLGLNPQTSLGSVATCLGGIGPGFDMTGPIGNYSMLPGLGKYVLMFIMILGRLEIFTVLVIFSPSFWKI